MIAEPLENRRKVSITYGLLAGFGIRGKAFACIIQRTNPINPTNDLNHLNDLNDPNHLNLIDQIDQTDQIN